MTEKPIHPATMRTPRLLLRALTHQDAPALFRIHSHPDAMRFMETPPHVTEDETRVKLAGMLANHACVWAICLPADDRAIGYVEYLVDTVIPGLGYILHPDHWRKGYGTEAVRAALDYGFKQLDLDRVELWINDDNIASRRLALSLGFTQRSRFRTRYPHERASHEKIVYGLYRYEWQAGGITPNQPVAAYGLQPVLSVLDVEESAAFYLDCLEFRLEFLYGDPPVHGAVTQAEWSSGGVTIQLSKADALPADRGGIVLYIFTDSDIDARYERIIARGVTVLQPLRSFPWGMREFQIVDNSGYVLRFGTPAQQCQT